jgi:hypothetical protein
MKKITLTAGLKMRGDLTDVERAVFDTTFISVGGTNYTYGKALDGHGGAISRVLLRAEEQTSAEDVLLQMIAQDIQAELLCECGYCTGFSAGFAYSTGREWKTEVPNAAEACECYQEPDEPPTPEQIEFDRQVNIVRDAQTIALRPLKDEDAVRAVFDSLAQKGLVRIEFGRNRREWDFKTKSYVPGRIDWIWPIRASEWATREVAR